MIGESVGDADAVVHASESAVDERRVERRPNELVDDAPGLGR
jgi:hypothetical protein